MTLPKKNLNRDFDKLMLSHSDSLESIQICHEDAPIALHAGGVPTIQQPARLLANLPALKLRSVP